jgi:hypothetical protein
MIRQMALRWAQPNPAFESYGLSVLRPCTRITRVGDDKPTRLIGSNPSPRFG